MPTNSPETSGKAPIRALVCLVRNKVWRALLPRPLQDKAEPAADIVAEVASIAPRLDADDRKILLAIARAAVARAAMDQDLAGYDMEPIDVPEKLKATGACFVTLTRNKSLRGCVGQIAFDQPLHRAVARNAGNAATRDPRFPAVQADELGEIRIEISVLSEPKAIAFDSDEELLKQLQPCRDGVVLKIGTRWATFLPQVWKQFPDKVEFLNQLSRKAGCRPFEWHGRETTVSTYSVEAFEEEN